MSDTTRSGCPSTEQLVDWLDGLLDAADERRIEAHLDGCAPCRQALLAWQERTAAAAEPGPDCPDDETIVAYGVAATTLDAATVGRLERHLPGCDRCTRLMQRAATPLPAGLEPRPSPRPSVAVPAAARARPSRLRQWLDAARAWIVVEARWPAVAVAAVLVIALARFVAPTGPPAQVRDVAPDAMVEITVDAVGHARPDAREPVVATVPHGTLARRLEVDGDWTRIELSDGRRVWVSTVTVQGADSR